MAETYTRAAAPIVLSDSAGSANGKEEEDAEVGAETRYVFPARARPTSIATEGHDHAGVPAAAVEEEEEEEEEEGREIEEEEEELAESDGKEGVECIEARARANTRPSRRRVVKVAVTESLSRM